MPIVKSITTPHGAVVAFHKAMQASLDIVAGTVAINVASWATEDDYIAGLGLVWMWPVDAIPAALSNIDAALVQIAPFDGGTIVVDASDTLAAAQVRALARMNDAMNAALNAGFTWSGSTFKSDIEARSWVLGSALASVHAAMTDAAFSEDWTLADDTVRTLSGDDVIAMALAFGAWARAILAQARVLRSSISASTTVAEVAAIQWPTGT